MLDDLQCPRCRETLVHCSNEFGNFWACAKCEGTAITVSLLRKFVERETINTLWQAARTYEYLRKVECPGCDKRMEEVPLQTPSGQRLVDVCGYCQFIWLDAGEWDALPHVILEDEPTLSREAQETIAVNEIERIREASEAEYGDGLVWDFWEHTPRDLNARAVMKFILSLLGRWP